VSASIPSEKGVYKKRESFQLKGKRGEATLTLKKVKKPPPFPYTAEVPAGDNRPVLGKVSTKSVPLKGGEADEKWRQGENADLGGCADEQRLRRGGVRGKEVRPRGGGRFLCKKVRCPGEGRGPQRKKKGPSLLGKKTGPKVQGQTTHLFLVVKGTGNILREKNKKKKATSWGGGTGFFQEKRLSDLLRDKGGPHLLENTREEASKRREGKLNFPETCFRPQQHRSPLKKGSERGKWGHFRKGLVPHVGLGRA